MWAKRFRTLVRKIRQVRQNSLLRTRKNYLTKLIFLKRIINVTFSDFQPFFFRLFPNFETDSQNGLFLFGKLFGQKLHIFEENCWESFLNICLRKIEQKFFYFCKSFSIQLSEVQNTCPLEKLRKFFLVEKHVI